MGRPKADNTVLVDAALLRWYKLDGGRDGRVLGLAIRDTAREPPNGFIREFDTLRKLLRRELCKLDNDALHSALSAARQRAMSYPQDVATHCAPVHGLLGTIAPGTQSPNHKALTADTAANGTTSILTEIEAWGKPDPARPTYGLSSLTGTLPFPIQNQLTSPYEFLLLADTFRSGALQLLLLTDRLLPLHTSR